MKYHKLQWLLVFTMLSVILSSCNLGVTPVPTQDIGAIQTQAFNQVLTQVAAAASPTPMPTNTPLPATATLSAPATFIVVGNSTPFAFNTPLSGLTPLALGVPTIAGSIATITTKNGCNNGTFTGESTPYDGQVIAPSYSYQKNFDIVNTGTCTWDEGYVFKFLPEMSTPGFQGYDIKIIKPEDFTPPGKLRTFSLKLRAAVQAGEHIGVWKLRDDGGNFFGPMVRIDYIIGTKQQRDAKALSESLTATKAAR
jgi:hypothetical protein